jgi:hypothetical protein
MGPLPQHSCTSNHLIPIELGYLFKLFKLFFFLSLNLSRLFGFLKLEQNEHVIKKIFILKVTKKEKNSLLWELGPISC